MWRDNAHLLDIINFCDSITSMVRLSTYDEFLADEVLQAAVMYRLTTIGEAARRLSDELRARDLDHAFRRAIALRNVIVHRYDGIQLDSIWETAFVRVPELKVLVSRLFDELEASPPTDE